MVSEKEKRCIPLDSELVVPKVGPELAAPRQVRLEQVEDFEQLELSLHRQRLGELVPPCRIDPSKKVIERFKQYTAQGLK